MQPSQRADAASTAVRLLGLVCLVQATVALPRAGSAMVARWAHSRGETEALAKACGWALRVLLWSALGSYLTLHGGRLYRLVSHGWVARDG